MENQEQEQEIHPKKRKKLLLGIIGGFVFIGLIFFVLWFFIWRHQESTRDAYVHGNQIVVTSQIPGYVTSFSVENTEVVEEGRILIELDRVDRENAFRAAKNALAEEVRTVTGFFENVGTLKAEKEMRKAEFTKAAQDYQHRKKLVEIGGVSKEDFQHSEAAFIAAFAAILAVQHQLRAATALVKGTTIDTHPLVEKAKDRLREAYINLQRCTIRAPMHGMVEMRRVQVGESITPETPLLTIVPLDQIWVNANYKEVQLKNVRIGQAVEMKSDIYGSSVKFYGKVIGISAATGSVMSVLPPQNATGNWIKIVQRLPVRISLDPEEIKRHPLRLGLSMNVTVDIRDTSGKMIPSPPPPGPLFQTDVFAKQEEGIEAIITQILKENTFERKNPKQS